MRLNLFTLTGLALLSNLALADVEPDEIPKQCQQVCHPVVQRSQHCDSTTQDDHAEKECLCKLNNASTVVPQCEACVAKYHSEVSDHSNPHDNDVYDIIQFCNFSTTTYNGGGAAASPTSSMGMTSMPSAASTGASPTGTGSASGSGSGSSSAAGGGAGGMTSPSASQSGSMPSASGSTSGSGAGSGSGNSMNPSSSSSGSAQMPSVVTNAAPALTPMIPAVGLLGLLTVAWM